MRIFDFLIWGLWTIFMHFSLVCCVSRRPRKTIARKFESIIFYSNREPFFSVELYFHRSSMDGRLELFEPAPRMTSTINMSSKLDPLLDTRVYLIAQILHRRKILLYSFKDITMYSEIEIQLFVFNLSSKFSFWFSFVNKVSI